MKKIFLGISNLLLVTIMFVYLWIGFGGESAGSVAESVCSSTSKTGLPVIGIIFSIPACIFTIITLCMDNKILIFIRDMFTFFASLFILASGIISVCITSVTLVYVPVILLVCAVMDVAVSGFFIVRAILAEDKAKAEETKIQ